MFVLYAYLVYKYFFSLNFELRSEADPDPVEKFPDPH